MQQRERKNETTASKSYLEPLLHVTSSLTTEIWCLIALSESRIIACSDSFLKLWELPAELPNDGVLALADDQITTIRAVGLYRWNLPTLGDFIDVMKNTEILQNRGLGSNAIRVDPHAILDASGLPLGRLVFVIPQPWLDPAASVARAVLLAVNAMHRLSEREHEITELLYQGLTNQAIALRLQISQKTVEKHRSHAMTKLGTRCFAELIRVIMLSKLPSGVA